MAARSRIWRKAGQPARGFSARASSRRKRAISASAVVPWTRTSAISRIDHARCAPSAAKLAKPWPAMALPLT
jgi:hypothetical protein